MMEQTQTDLPLLPAIQALTDEDRDYIKYHLPRFLTEIQDGQRFMMSRVQIYNDEPYDFTSVFVKTDGQVFYDKDGLERPIGPNCMLVLV